MQFCRFLISRVLIGACVLGLSISCGGPEKTKSTRLDLYPLPQNAVWPKSNWSFSTPEKQGLDPKGLQAVEAYAFQKTGDDLKKRTGFRTDGLVIVRNGYLVYEKYDRGNTKETKHLLWSISKSFQNALIGMAVLDGRLKLEDAAARYYPPLQAPRKRDITIRHLLNMSSGLYWQETYEFAPLKSLVVAMLYTRGRKDMAAFTARQPMRYDPGLYLEYSSGTTNLLSGILKNILKEEYEEFPWKRLFAPLGIQDATWETDESGSYVASSYLYMTARDLARFGYLYLNDGVWNNKRLLPEGWVDFTRSPAPAYHSTKPYENIVNYQLTAHWYSNQDIPDSYYHAPWPDAPRDTFAALGHWGQRLFVIPSLNMVVVRFADEKDHSFDLNHFLKLIKSCVRQQTSNMMNKQAKP